MGKATLLVLILLAGWPALAVAEPAPAEAELAELMQQLDADNFVQTSQAVERIARSGHPRAVEILETLLAGNLQSRRSDGRIVVVKQMGRDFAITDVLSGEDLGTVGRRDLNRISINNALRSQIRVALARASLNAPNPATRLAAVRELMASPEAENLTLLQEHLAQETEPQVRTAIEVAMALNRLDDDDPAVRIAAIDHLTGNLQSQVRNRLRTVSEDDPEAAVRDAATEALASIQCRLDSYRLMENVFFGLSLGSVLLLAAIGLAITFGVMGVINMAHGELIMIGAYTTYMIQQLFPGAIEYSVLIAIPAAFIVAGLFGIAIERGVIRFLYGRPLETLLATFGISLMLQQLVRTTISAQNVPVISPSWMSGSWQINEALALTWNRLYILIFALLVFISLLLALKRTRLGLKMRAVTQNRSMAQAMGVRTAWVDALTFGLGAGIAGVAGVALSQLTNVGPNLGQGYIIDSFLVVVFGGVGNLWGTLVGAFSLGVLNKFIEPWSGAVLAKILVLVFVILFIQRYPRGLFPQKGRAAGG
jgi:urea transport system permease protein